MFKNKKVTTATLLMASLGAGAANAALPTGLDTAIDGVTTDFGLLMAEYWPVYIAVTIAFIILKQFKRASSKV